MFFLFTRTVRMYSGQLIEGWTTSGLVTLFLLGATQLEMLAAFQNDLVRPGALFTLEFQHHLLCRLDLFLEHGLRLPTEPSLFTVVPPLSLRHQGGFPGLLLPPH